MELALIYYANGTGGTAYERQLLRCLKKRWAVEEHSIQRPAEWPSWARTPAALIGLYRAVQQTSSRPSLVIESLDASLLRRGGVARNWVIVHHLDFSANRHAKIYEPLAPYILRCLRRAEKVIVVSEFWKRYLEARGVPDPELICNPFSSQEFSFAKVEIDALRHKLELNGKPILYLGNRAEGKGAERAYRALRHLDVHFVATGSNAQPLDGLKTEYLGERDYRLLLCASSVAVTMSTFDEGWCRTAHEAMLCGTPVIGSGRGGMRELLESGQQVICPSFDQLPAHVSSLLNDAARRNEMGERGRAFASGFTIERFESAWTRLVEQYADAPPVRRIAQTGANTVARS